MKLVIGLGNPGPQYEGTRHNVGFEVIDLLAGRWQLQLTREKFDAWFTDGAFKEQRVALLKPTTFMNRSGRSVAAAVNFYGVDLAGVMVISDDFALPCGALRLRRGGSAGGHNGLQDIMDRLGSDQYPRLRLGVGPPWGQTTSYVLMPFDREQQPLIRRSVEKAADAVESWIEDGIEKTMNRFNAKEEG